MTSSTRRIRWRHIAQRAVVGASVLAVLAVVGSSLDPTYYYFRSAAERSTFVPDRGAVATAFVLSAAEGVVLCAIVCAGHGLGSWRRLLLALIIFAPWLFVVWEQVGTHVPGFLMVNAAWVTLIVIFLTAGLLVSSVTHLRKRWARTSLGSTTNDADRF